MNTSHISADLTRNTLQVMNISDNELANIILSVTGNSMGKSMIIASTLHANATIEIPISDNKLLNNNNKFMFEYVIHNFKYWTNKIKPKSFVNVYYNCNFQVFKTTKPNISNIYSPISISSSTSATSSPTSSPSSLHLSDTRTINHSQIGATLEYNSNSKTKTKTKKKSKSKSRKSRKKVKPSRGYASYISIFENKNINARVIIGSKHMQFSIENMCECPISNVKVKLYQHRSDIKSFKRIRFGKIEDSFYKTKSVRINSNNNIFVSIKWEYIY